MKYRQGKEAAFLLHHTKAPLQAAIFINNKMKLRRIISDTAQYYYRSVKRDAIKGAAHQSQANCR